MGFRASLLSFVLSVYVCGLTQQVKGRDWSSILLQFLYQIIFFIFTFELHDDLNWGFSVKKKKRFTENQDSNVWNCLVYAVGFNVQFWGFEAFYFSQHALPQQLSINAHRCICRVYSLPPRSELAARCVTVTKTWQMCLGSREPELPHAIRLKRSTGYSYPRSALVNGLVQRED